MERKKYKYIYGPVSSWRLGSSLGIDPLSKEGKICSFDCLYCQIGKTNLLTKKRDVYVEIEDLVKELEELPSLKIDYITFSGTGEPTLASNLGDMIRSIRKIKEEKVAVLTNSSLMYREDVQKDLFAADLVVAKLDASSQDVLKLVNKPIESIRIEDIIHSIKEFKDCYIGKLALQIMFVGQNKKYAGKISEVVKEIAPDEVQINTPLRPCEVEPLSRQELEKVEEEFKGLNVISVYDSETKSVEPVSKEDTIKRRGKK